MPALGKTIIFASGNKNKYNEVAELLAPLKIRLVFGPSYASLDVEETAQTYMGNAFLKARSWADCCGLPALADDSGLEVRALNWSPGIRSARIAPTSSQRNQWLLQVLEGKDDRVAKYVAAFALCLPEEGQVWLTEGECWGNITWRVSGTGGFGYDPLFIPMGYSQTFAELPPEIKARISHRAIASYQLVHILQRQIW